MNDKLTKEEAEQLFKINVEMQARCGNGDGTYTHSINCNCHNLKSRRDKILKRELV